MVHNIFPIDAAAHDTISWFGSFSLLDLIGQERIWIASSLPTKIKPLMGCFPRPRKEIRTACQSPKKIAARVAARRRLDRLVMHPRPPRGSRSRSRDVRCESSSTCIQFFVSSTLPLLSTNHPSVTVRRCSCYRHWLTQLEGCMYYWSHVVSDSAVFRFTCNHGKVTW